jgi:hypothetical protein
MNREELALFVRNHGIARTSLRYLFKTFRRLIVCDLMRVETSSGSAIGPIVDTAYVTRQVTAEEYREGVRWLGEGHERQWAFDRGDRCFANLLDSRVVGYQFYAQNSTRIRPGLAFEFPLRFTYSYASFTHADHRGKRLAKFRANARRNADEAAGIRREVVWYVSVDNYNSRSVSRHFQSTLLGYAAFVKIGKKYLCYMSRGCKKAGISLVSTSD